MKKVVIFMAGCLISGATFAQVATGTFTMGGTTAITNNICGLLNENVTLNLSAGVNGGVDCSSTRVGLATCHTGGRTVSRSVTVQTPEGCGVIPEGGTEEDIVACIGTETRTTSGAAMATASSLAGTVTSRYPGAGTVCAPDAALTSAAAMPQ